MASARAIVGKAREVVLTSAELVRGLWRGRFWWLVPLVLFLLPLAVVFIALQAYPIVAPFVYTLF